MQILEFFSIAIFYYVSPTSLVHQVLSFNKSVKISPNFEIVKDIYNMRVLTVKLWNINIVKNNDIKEAEILAEVEGVDYRWIQNFCGEISWKKSTCKM